MGLSSSTDIISLTFVYIGQKAVILPEKNIFDNNYCLKLLEKCQHNYAGQSDCGQNQLVIF